MLADSQVMAFVAVADMARARTFYEGVLKLTPVSADQYGVVVAAGGVHLRITQPPQRIPAAYTVLGFAVADIEAKVAALAGAGVSFERYEFLGDAQAANGVWTTPDGGKVAWFKDPDDNLLSLSQHVF